MSTDHYYLQRCKKDIETKFGLDPESMTERDFEWLHQKVWNQSHIHLSTATLRRIWRSNPETQPQIKTLDALAQLLGHPNWYEYKMKQQTIPAHHGLGRWTLGGILLALVVVILHADLLPASPKKRNITSDKLSFSVLDSVVQGVPATAGFAYQLNEIKEKAEIVLSWNPDERHWLDPKASRYSGVYFYPDYHQTTLLLDGSVARTDYVHVTTPGWYTAIMEHGCDVRPIGVAHPPLELDGRLYIDDAVASHYNVDLKEGYFSVFALSHTQLDSVSADAFSVSFDVSLPETHARIGCQVVELVITGEYDDIRIPLFQPGCHGYSMLKASEHLMSGAKSNLSGLTLPNQKACVQLRNQSQRLSIAIGGVEKQQITYSKPLGRLKSVKFVFAGPGAVERFALASVEKFK